MKVCSCGDMLVDTVDGQTVRIDSDSELITRFQ